jgi:hypothetical protein
VRWRDQLASAAGSYAAPGAVACLRAVDNGLGSIEERRLAGVTLAQLGREPDVRPSELRS